MFKTEKLYVSNARADTDFLHLEVSCPTHVMFQRVVQIAVTRASTN